MKNILLYLSVLLLLAGPVWFAEAAEKAQSPSGKAAAPSVVQDVKTETVKVYTESKDAIVRDAKAMKEDIPRGLREARDSAVRQSKAVKDGAAETLSEARENLTPAPKP